MATTLFFMVDIVQLEERLIVAQKVVSSSLTIHPLKCLYGLKAMIHGFHPCDVGSIPITDFYGAYADMIQ